MLKFEADSLKFWEHVRDRRAALISAMRAVPGAKFRIHADEKEIRRHETSLAAIQRLIDRRASY